MPVCSSYAINHNQPPSMTSGHLSGEVHSLSGMAAFEDGSDRTLSRKRFCFRAFVDIICICFVAGPVLIINVVAEPYHRGFFCDDQSLMHPVREDTIPTWLLVLVAIGLPVFCILSVECLLQRTTHCCVLVPTEIPVIPKSCLEVSYRSIVVFFFGIAITQLLTEIGKYSIGRLRPHFLSLCQPENVPSNCSNIFITENLCTGEENFQMKQARLSFPSGHASMSMFAASFLMVFLQTRLVCNQAKLLRPILQLGIFSLAFYTCLSRVSDYKHHWSDVLGGAVLGIAVCVLIVVSMTGFHHLLQQRDRTSAAELRKERLPLYRQENNTSSSSTDQDTIQVHVENQKL